MVTTAVIDLTTEDKKLKAKARTIAVDAATGFQSANYVGDRGDRLEIICQSIDVVTVVDKIRKQLKLPNAKPISQY